MSSKQIIFKGSELYEKIVKDMITLDDVDIEYINQVFLYF
jgi:hypothetical protein